MEANLTNAGLAIELVTVVIARRLINGCHYVCVCVTVMDVCVTVRDV